MSVPLCMSTVPLLENPRSNVTVLVPNVRRTRPVFDKNAPLNTLLAVASTSTIPLDEFMKDETFEILPAVQITRPALLSCRPPRFTLPANNTCPGESTRIDCEPDSDPPNMFNTPSTRISPEPPMLPPTTAMRPLLLIVAVPLRLSAAPLIVMACPPSTPPSNKLPTDALASRVTV